MPGHGSEIATNSTWYGNTPSGTSATWSWDVTSTQRGASEGRVGAVLPLATAPQVALRASCQCRAHFSSWVRTHLLGPLHQDVRGLGGEGGGEGRGPGTTAAVTVTPSPSLSVNL